MMQVGLIQDLEDQLALLPGKARQSHQGWAQRPTPLPVGLHMVLSPRRWEQCLSCP